MSQLNAENFFVDDYEHCPEEDQKQISQIENYEIAYSISLLKDEWYETIAEDVWVTIVLKDNG